MKLFNFIAIISHASANEYEDNDMRFTRCQADFLATQGLIVNETIADEGDCDQSTARGATDVWPLWNNKWDADRNKFVVPYYFAPDYADEKYGSYTGTESIAAIIRNLAAVEPLTCVSFTLIDENDKSKYTNRLRVSWDKVGGCSSYIGRNFADQPVNLRPDCAVKGKQTTAQHEFMHALGFWHEHQRPDRDKYVQLHPEKLKDDESTNVNYGKMDFLDWVDLDSPYDFQSIMHYGVWNMKDNRPSIAVAGDPRKAAPVNRKWPLSDQDAYQINKFYECEIINKCVEAGKDSCGGGLHKCINQPIGYTCDCATGYQLSEDASGIPTCVDINECSSGDPCAGSRCFNSIGSFSCGDPLSTVHEMVFMIDGTGSYKSHRASACQSFVDSIRKFKTLKEDRPHDLYRLGLSLYSDRVFTNDEFSSTSPRYYDIPIPLQNVEDMTDSRISDAYNICTERLASMYNGGDSKEDMLGGLIWTRSALAMGWNDDSIKSVVVATDVGYWTQKDKPLGSRIPPTSFNSATHKIEDLYIFGDGYQTEVYRYYEEEAARHFVFVNENTKYDYVFISLACNSGCTESQEQLAQFPPADSDEESMSIAQSASITDQFEQMSTNLIKFADVAEEKATDPDECELDTHNCHVDATCTNKSPGYECTCNRDLIGDGFSCTIADPCLTLSCDGDHQSCSKGACHCATGYIMMDGTCVDVNECAIIEKESDPKIVTTDTTVPPCAGGATCHNLNGGYECLCDAVGWEEMDGDCVHIDSWKESENEFRNRMFDLDKGVQKLYSWISEPSQFLGRFKKRMSKGLTLLRKKTNKDEEPCIPTDDIFHAPVLDGSTSCDLAAQIYDSVIAISEHWACQNGRGKARATKQIKKIFERTINFQFNKKHCL